MADNVVRYRTVLDDRTSGPLARLRDQFEKVGGRGSAASFFGNVGAMAFAKGLDLIGDAAGSAIDFIDDSIDAASNLQETLTKSEVIFGENSDAMEEWADTAAESFGQSKRAALDAASTFAGLFDTAGINLGKATGMAQKLTELGSDLASFFNTDVDEALQAIRSGLAGESEPLRRFNVFLSETAVTAKLVEMGQERVNGQWTEGQKILGRYQIILDSTGKAQGDFARTADGLANSQRTLNASLEDLQAELGQQFLPVARQVTQWQIDFIEGAGVVADWLTVQTDEAAALAEAMRRLGGNFGYVNGHRTTAIAFAQQIAREWEEAAASGMVYGQTLVTTADDARESAAIMAGSASDVGDATVDMADDSIKALEDYESEWERVRSVLSSTAGAFADALWDPIILKTEIAANEHEQAELRKVRASKTATAEEKRDAEQRINELQKHRFEMLAELASYGDESARQTLRHQLDVLESTKNLSQEQREEMARLRAALGLVRTAWLGVYKAAVAATNVNPYVGDFGYGRAEGGPVKANTAYIVGEDGPELFVPGMSGSIVPAAESGGTVSLAAYDRAAAWGAMPARPVYVYLDGRLVGRGLIDPMDDEMYWRLASSGGATIEG